MAASFAPHLIFDQMPSRLCKHWAFTKWVCLAKMPPTTRTASRPVVALPGAIAAWNGGRGRHPTDAQRPRSTDAQRPRCNHWAFSWVCLAKMPDRRSVGARPRHNPVERRVQSNRCNGRMSAPIATMKANVAPDGATAGGGFERMESSFLRAALFCTNVQERAR